MVIKRTDRTKTRRSFETFPKESLQRDWKKDSQTYETTTGAQIQIGTNSNINDSKFIVS